MEVDVLDGAIIIITQQFSQTPWAYRLLFILTNFLVIITLETLISVLINLCGIRENHTIPRDFHDTSLILRRQKFRFPRVREQKK